VACGAAAFGISGGRSSQEIRPPKTGCFGHCRPQALICCQLRVLRTRAGRRARWGGERSRRVLVFAENFLVLPGLLPEHPRRLPERAVGWAPGMGPGVGVYPRQRLAPGVRAHRVAHSTPSPRRSRTPLEGRVHVLLLRGPGAITRVYPLGLSDFTAITYIGGRLSCFPQHR
jgi:hypothetical protein